jgi:hypothetical protein
LSDRSCVDLDGVVTNAAALTATALKELRA